MTTLAAALWALALWIGCMRAFPPFTAAAGLLSLGVALWLSKRGHRRGALSLALVGLMLIGAGLAGGRELLARRSPLVEAAATNAVIEVGGRIVTDPRAADHGRWALLRVSRLGHARVATRALLQLDADQHVTVGQAVVATAAASPLPSGGFGRYVRGLGAVATLRPVSPLGADPAPWPLALTTAIRQRASRSFAAALPATPAALLGGLTLGTRDGIPTAELEAAGLSHLVVVSGGHVVVLLACLLAIASASGIGLRGRCRLGLGVVWWFVVLTRWEPSVLRAALMTTLVLIGMLRGRASDAAYTLAMTVILLLLADPLLARQPGFALSVLATGGVLYGARGRQNSGRIAGVLAATIGAQIATAPVILWLAGTIPLASLPANLVAGPAAVACQAVGSVAATLATLQLPGAVAVARLAAPPLAVLWWSASAFAGLPALDRGDVVVLAVIALVLVAISAPRTLVVTAAVLVLAATVVISYLPAPSPRDLRLTVLDVGQGDGLLVEAPDGDDGARMVVDGGPDPLALAGQLRARRISALDALLLTHAHDDHSGGLAVVLRRVRVAVLLVPDGIDLSAASVATSAHEAIAAARARQVPIVGLHAGMRFTLGAATVEVLAPSVALPAGGDANATSIVVRVTGDHGRMLLTGDSEAQAQEQMLARPDLLRADVLKVPHHGGATNTPGFLDAVQAKVAVMSVGADNRYGHPNRDTLVDLAPVPVWRTDRHGSVAVTLTPAGPVVDNDV